MAVLGAFCAIVVEWLALLGRYWSYTDRMPIVPVVGAGLLPLLQLTLLMPVALGIAVWRPRSLGRRSADGNQS